MNSHLRDTGLPLYLLSCSVESTGIGRTFLSNLSARELDSSTGRAADRYSEGTSSNPTRANIFQLTSAVSDYHEKISVHESVWFLRDLSAALLSDLSIIDQLTQTESAFQCGQTDLHFQPNLLICFSNQIPPV